MLAARLGEKVHWCGSPRSSKALARLGQMSFEERTCKTRRIEPDPGGRAGGQARAGLVVTRTMTESCATAAFPAEASQTRQSR